MSKDDSGTCAVSVDELCSTESTEISKGKVEHSCASSPAAPATADGNNKNQDKTLIEINHEDDGADTPPGETLPSTAYRIRNESERHGGAVSDGVKISIDKGGAGDGPSPMVVSPASTYEESTSSPRSDPKRSPRVVSPETRGNHKEREENIEEVGRETEADDSAGTTTILHFDPETVVTVVFKVGRTNVEEAVAAGGKSLEKGNGGLLDKKEEGLPKQAITAGADTAANTGEKAKKKRAKAIAVAESKRAAALALKNTDYLASGEDALAALIDNVRLVFRSALERCEVSSSQIHCEDERKSENDDIAIITIDPHFLAGDGCRKFLQLASKILQAEGKRLQKCGTGDRIKPCATKFMSSMVPSNDVVDSGEAWEWAHSRPDWLVSLVGKGNVDERKLSPALTLLLGMELAVRQSYLRSVMGQKSAVVGTLPKKIEGDLVASPGVDARRSMDIVLASAYGMKGTSSDSVNMASFVPSSSNLPHPDGEEGSSTEQFATPPQEMGDVDEEEEHPAHDVLVGGKIVGSIASLHTSAKFAQLGTTKRSEMDEGNDSSDVSKLVHPTTSLKDDVITAKTESTTQGCTDLVSIPNNDAKVNDSLYSLLDLCRRLRKFRGVIGETAEQKLMEEYTANSNSGNEMGEKSHAKKETQPPTENLLLTPLSWFQSRCSDVGKKNEATGLERVRQWAASWNNKILPAVLDRLAGVLANHPEMFAEERPERQVESHSPPCMEPSLEDDVSSNSAQNKSKQHGKVAEKDVALKPDVSAEAAPQSQGSSSSKKKKKKNKKKRKKSAAAATDKSKQPANTTEKNNDVVGGNKKDGNIATVSPSASEEGGELCSSGKITFTSAESTVDINATSSAGQEMASASKEATINASSHLLPRTNSNITISRVDGVGATCVVVEQLGRRGDDEKEQTSSQSGNKAGEENDNKDDDDADGDGSAWEKVSTKSRGGRSRKSGGAVGNRAHGKGAQASTASFPDRHVGGTSQSSTDAQTARKSKSGRNKASRVRLNNRKIAKDMVFHILDKVDEEANRRQKQARRAYAEERRKANDERKRAIAAERLAALAEQKQRSASVPSLSSGSTGNGAGSQHRNTGASLRDVVVGGGTGGSSAANAADPNKPAAQSMPKSARVPEKPKLPPQARKGQATALTPSLVAGGVGAARKSNETRSNKSQKQHVSSSSMDQNTAPTVPETLSGVSAHTQSSSNTDDEGAKSSGKSGARTGSNQKTTDSRDLAGVTDGSVSRSVEDAVGHDAKGLNSRQHNHAHANHPSSSPSANEAEGDDGSGEQPPPLPTLLGPGNTNSASSSVASSLEAPHSSRFRGRCSSGSAKENDVGYHLLDVCDRLSNDMNTFMRRRATALSLRRRERGALLAALQDTVSKIWAGRCHVEMYGSCATQLDLPSSDLDVVICGLDHDSARHQASPSHSAKSHKHNKHKKRFSTEGDSQQQQSIDQTSPPLSPHHHHSNHHHQHNNHHHHHHHHHPHYPPLSPNASRVLRLSAELERQPWAVQVKAIPTASVPVIKILADPSLLPGAAALAVGGNGDWLIHHQHMSAAAAAAATGIPHAPPPPPPPPTSSNDQQQAHGYYAPNHPAPNMGLSPPPSAYHPPHTLPPWRGADIMNGLLSIDITFEGPEHGGVGSTAYSARVVQDACNETGLPPESTPAVQVTMVLKELLAQRRLNEPFSGGLSSYALLLLVVAVMKQWRAIREEMEQIERQRQAVATGSDTSSNSHAPVAGVSEADVTEAVSAGEGTGNQVVWPIPSPSSEQQQQQQDSQSPSAPPSSTSSAASLSNTTDKLAQEKSQQQPNNTISETVAAAATSKPSSSTNTKSSAKSSWASIARKKSQASNSSNTASTRTPASGQARSQTQKQHPKTAPAPSVDKVSANTATTSSAGVTDTVCRGAGASQPSTKEWVASSKQSTATEKATGRSRVSRPDSQSKRSDNAHHIGGTSNDNLTSQNVQGHGNPIKEDVVSIELPTSVAPSLFPQGSNDVLEVLCSGEPTAGKLLMHFLLFYGQYFDSQQTAIDVGGANHPDFNQYLQQLSPFMPRRPGGTIDPITGMFTVDPIVVYDPLEGAEGNNVAKSCFAWSSIRWVFAQCYMTLSSAVERSGGGSSRDRSSSRSRTADEPPTSRSSEGAVDDPTHETVEGMSPILELLLSF